MPHDRPYPVLDLFSGYGGFSLAFESVTLADASGERRSEVGGSAPANESEHAGWSAVRNHITHRDGQGAAFRTIGFSEIDPYACAILSHRFPDVPNLGPVQHVTRDSVLATCGELPLVVTGGFPCQPHSAAGKRRASNDDRDLWPECWRVLRDLRPRFALFENVPGLLSSESGLFLNRVLSDLAEIGFACSWEVVSAADVAAPHRRERVWLLCVDEGADWRGAAGRLRGERGSLRELADRSSGGQRERGSSALAGRERHVNSSGAGLADRSSARLQGLEISGSDRSHWPQSDDQLARGCDSSDRARWPAAFGHWPARPGEQQHAWEPPRVVADSANARALGRYGLEGDAGRGGSGDATGRSGGDGGCGVEAGFVGNTGSEQRDGAVGGTRGRREPANTGGGEAESELGGGPARRSARLDAAALQVHEAAEGDAVNRTHRLKALGNGIVPAVAYIFAAAIADVLEFA
jgi:DNA-cytosine methyltransferase